MLCSILVAKSVIKYIYFLDRGCILISSYNVHRVVVLKDVQSWKNVDMIVKSHSNNSRKLNQKFTIQKLLLRTHSTGNPSISKIESIMSMELLSLTTIPRIMPKNQEIHKQIPVLWWNKDLSSHRKESRKLLNHPLKTSMKKLKQ